MIGLMRFDAHWLSQRVRNPARLSLYLADPFDGVNSSPSRMASVDASVTSIQIGASSTRDVQSETECASRPGFLSGLGKRSSRMVQMGAPDAMAPAAAGDAGVTEALAGATQAVLNEAAGQAGQNARGFAEGLLQGVTTGLTETMADALDVAADLAKEGGLIDEDEMPQREPPPPDKIRFTWFKYACCGSWMIIGGALAMLTMTLICLGELSKIEVEVCAEPEITFNTTEDCRSLLNEYAVCLDTHNPLNSAGMRECFLELGDPKAAAGSARAYRLAMRYENKSVPVELARNLMMQELALENRRRLLGQPWGPLAETGGGARVWSGALGDAVEGIAGSELRPLRRVSEKVSAAEQALDDAYATIATASVVGLIGAGKIEYLYAWTAAVAVMGLLSSVLALRSLGNSPPGCCRNPTQIEKMHKVGLRCSCHVGWVFGMLVLLWSVLNIGKYQVLYRYHDGSSTVPARWGISSIYWPLFPCIIGVITGLLPSCHAMVISRSRAERRDALVDNLGALRRMQKDRKKGSGLTAPKRMSSEPPPNPASLNPIFKDGKLVYEERVERIIEFGADGGRGPSSAPAARNSLSRARCSSIESAPHASFNRASIVSITERGSVGDRV